MSDPRRRKGPIGGLFGLIGTGVGMAAEYHEHRKEQKQARTQAQQESASSVADPTSRSVEPPSGPPPAYADVSQNPDRALEAGPPASDDKKRRSIDANDLTDPDSSDSDDESIEDDEEMWELDDAITPVDSQGLPSYEESEASKQVEPVDDLVREVMGTASNHKAGSDSKTRAIQPLPCPVIIPQRRPRKKSRGFVRAYAPVLEYSGIDQDTFLSFLKNFHKSSQASPIFPIIQVAAGIAGFAPSVIAMAVTTAVQVAAGVGAEMQSRTRTNTFLYRMNEELFKPAGLYAMIIKYKSDAEMEQAANRSGLISSLIKAEKVDLSTNQVIAKYSSDTSESSRSMSDRMQNLRLASNTSHGTHSLPECAPLIFPQIDRKVELEGPETFKDKTKDAKKFLADYLDRRAQMQYASQDPNSQLNVPEGERSFRSSLADPNHPMRSGGLVALVSGGKLSPRMDKRERRMEKSLRRDERRIARGRMPRDRRRHGDEYYDELTARTQGRDILSARYEDYRRGSRGVGGPAPHAPYAPYGGDRAADVGEGSSSRPNPYRGSSRRQQRRGGGGGPIGTVKRVMREDVLYLMIVNMPSEAELAEARDELARAKAQA